MPTLNVDDEATRIAREITLIACTSEFGELRSDMVDNLLMLEFVGKSREDCALLVVTAVNTMRMLSITIEALADELTGVS
jgi:hypothetical protein